MKSLWFKTKWLTKHVRPFAFRLCLIVVLGVICSIGTIYRALLLKKLFDTSILAQIQQSIISITLLALFIFGDICLRTIISLVSTRTSTEISNNIQQYLYIHLTKTNWLEYSKYHSGDILTRMTSDVDTVTSVVVNILPNIISLVALLIGSFITALYFDPFLGILALILGPTTVLISRFYALKLKKLYIKIQEAEASFRSFLHESIQNMVIIKTFCLEENSAEHIDKLQNEKLKLILSRSHLSNFSNAILSSGTWLGFFIVYCWGAFNLSNGTITFGTLTALLQLFGGIQGPFSGLASSLPQVISSVASTERLMELEMLELDLRTSLKTDLTSAGVHLENVTFGYKKNETILKNINAKIYPGEIVALIGSSGEGKTTLIRLLLSLIYPDNGDTFITNDQEKIKINAASRKLISYVPQGNTLFSGTIADNLRLGSAHASDIELESAARLACAWDFIENLPDGLDTIIGERGLGLSEGQAQRIAIARALLHKSPIILFDEATSALDANTEIKVLENIQNLTPSPTCIIITHRPNAFNICNRVFKLENGTLVEERNHGSYDIAAEIM